MITIYGKPNCKFCKKAVDLLSLKEIGHEYHCLSDNPDKLNEFKSQGFKTVPIIYRGAELIGGYNELEALYPMYPEAQS